MAVGVVGARSAADQPYLSNDSPCSLWSATHLHGKEVLAHFAESEPLNPPYRKALRQFLNLGEHELAHSEPD